MPRFFIPETLPQAGEYALPDDVVRHVQVLRMRADDEMRLFDGNGGEVRAFLRDQRHRAAATRRARRRLPAHERLLVLAVRPRFPHRLRGLPQPERRRKLRLVRVRAAVELGVLARCGR